MATELFEIDDVCRDSLVMSEKMEKKPLVASGTWLKADSHLQVNRCEVLIELFNLRNREKWVHHIL